MVKTFFEGAMGFVPQQQPDFNKLLFSASWLYCSLTNAFFSSFDFHIYNFNRIRTYTDIMDISIYYYSFLCYQ